MWHCSDCSANLESASSCVKCNKPRPKIEAIELPSIKENNDYEFRKVIDIQTNSLEEAQVLAYSKIPGGWTIKSEEIIEDGKIASFFIGGDPSDQRNNDLWNVIWRVPPGSKIISEQLVENPTMVLPLEIQAYDSADARRKADDKWSQTKHIISVEEKIPGRKGFLGFGRQEGTYQINTMWRIGVQGKYQAAPMIRLVAEKVLSNSEVGEAISTLYINTLAKRVEIDRPVQGQLAAVMLMTSIFDYLKKAAVQFNHILLNSKILYPEDKALQSLDLLKLEPPNTIDVNDIPLISTQFDKAINAMKHLKDFFPSQTGSAGQ